MSLFFEIQGSGRHTSCRLSAAIDPLIIQILQPNPVCPAPVTCNDLLMSNSFVSLCYIHLFSPNKTNAAANIIIVTALLKICA